MNDGSSLCTRAAGSVTTASLTVTFPSTTARRTSDVSSRAQRARTSTSGSPIGGVDVESITLLCGLIVFGRGLHERAISLGRLREFLQFNADILGESSPQADAEILALAID
ncbi:hypothetical protein EBZ80_23515, partial [bacterium]|nr:hypothetical protein [bacterium]